MVTLGKKSQPRGCSKIAISSGFRIVDDISGLGGEKTGGVPYKGPPHLATDSGNHHSSTRGT